MLKHVWPPSRKFLIPINSKEIFASMPPSIAVYKPTKMNKYQTELCGGVRTVQTISSNYFAMIFDGVYEFTVHYRLFRFPSIDFAANYIAGVLFVLFATTVQSTRL